MPDLHQFEAFARCLAHRYYLYGRAGGDADDVAQEAMIAAWQASLAYQANAGCEFAPFVRQRMQWRVLDYVRIRKSRQKLAEREAGPIDEWQAVGPDSTLQTVLDRDDLARLAAEMRRLSWGQAVAIHGAINGLSSADIAPDRHAGTIAAQTHRARERLAAAIA